MNADRIGAGILAGGKSTRMGKNKILLTYGGQNFLEHICGKCRIFPELLVSVSDVKLYKGLPYHFVEDEKKEYGPVEGIYQLLLATRMEYVFVLAADMPEITGGFLKAMAAAHRGEDCLVLKTSEGGLHPLCAVYAKRLLPELERMRERGERKPRRLYDRCTVRYITPGELGFSDDVVRNINTPEEYERMTADKRRNRKDL